ncbi:MAG: hypothetical protein ACKORI_02630, partial [Verrucomicrobiota bacterium]
MDAAGAEFEFKRTNRKPAYPVGEELRSYLVREGREVELPVSYRRLRSFTAAMPLLDRDGRDTLWETVAYPPEEMEHLSRGLLETYALLRGEGGMSVFSHVYVDR